MRRGEIWWARIPMRGATPKRRPMLVVSDDVFNGNERYPKVMAVHLTSADRPGRVGLRLGDDAAGPAPHR